MRESIQVPVPDVGARGSLHLPWEPWVGTNAPTPSPLQINRWRNPSWESQWAPCLIHNRIRRRIWPQILSAYLICFPRNSQNHRTCHGVMLSGLDHAQHQRSSFRCKGCHPLGVFGQSTRFTHLNPRIFQVSIVPVVELWPSPSA